ncbi:MAG: hypothetical protein Q9225_001887 [Loekoesia sp. 1 TL-2023]
MSINVRDSLTERKYNDGKRCRLQSQRKCYRWQSGRPIEAQSERLGDPNPDGKGLRHRFLALAEHTASQTDAGGKGDWLLESPDFQQWCNLSDSAFLWVSGIPGSGKTTLVNRVRAEIQSWAVKTKPTINFYLQYDEGRPEDPTKVILKSLVDKICAPDTPLKDRSQAQRLASTARQKCPPADSLALRYLFRSLLDSLSPEVESFFLIDSFDDYPHVIEALLSEIAARARDEPPTRIFKTLVSYRSSCKALHGYVEDTIASGNGFRVDLAENTAAKTSLARYIKIEEDRLMYTNPEGEPKIRRMVRLVQQRSASSFLWAKLALEIMSQHLNSGSELDTLDWCLLPLTLGEIYQQRLDLALSKNGAWLMETLKWVLYAAHPLTVLELNGALLQSSSFAFKACSDLIRCSADSGGLEAALNSTCCGLLEISENHHLVFAHRTVREYLCDSTTRGYQSQLNFDYIQCHESLAMACLQCLIEYNRAQSNQAINYGDLYSQHTFRIYAKNHWMEHYRIAEAQSLQLTGLLYEYLLCLRSSEEKLYGWQGQRAFCRSTLGFCSVSGFTQLCKVILQMGTPVDVHDDFHPVTPLHLAVSSGHHDTVRLLLEYGANIDATTSSGETALFLAARNDDLIMVKLLLDFKSDVKAIYPKMIESLVHVAAANGAVSVVSHLLGTDHPETDEGYVFGDTEKLVKAKHPPCRYVYCEFGSSEPDLPCQCGKCQLDSASEHEKNYNFCDESSISYLEARSDIEWTPLHYAAANGHDNIVRLLLRLGADSDAETKEGQSALVLALQNGHTGVVNLLKEFSKSAVHARSMELEAQTGQGLVQRLTNIAL